MMQLIHLHKVCKAQHTLTSYLLVNSKFKVIQNVKMYCAWNKMSYIWTSMYKAQRGQNKLNELYQKYLNNILYS